MPEELFQQAQHKTADGRTGIPCSAFRNAMISACRLVGFHMTKAKLSVFVMPDAFDALDGEPLVYINGTPELCQRTVRNESGVVDVRIRPMWREWSATVRIRYDGDQFTAADVFNLLRRVGMQVGIGEGRADTKSSPGCGWGPFDVKQNA